MESKMDDVNQEPGVESLADLAASAMEEALTGKAPEADGEQGEEVPAEPAPEPEAQTPAEPQEPSQEAQAEEPAQAQEEVQPQPEQPDTLGLQSMNAEERTQFEALPPDAQAAASAFLQRREQDMVRQFNKKLSDVSSLKTDFGPVSEMFEPFRDQLKRNNMTPFAYIKGLADMDRFASQDPLGYMEHVAKVLNVDKQQLADRLGLAPKEDDPFSDPLDIAGDQASTQPQAQPPAQPQPAQPSPEVLEVQQFANEMVNGVILRPHFNTVWRDMSYMADFNQNASLQQLYEQACQMHGLENPAHPAPPAEPQAANFDAAKEKIARAQTASKVASSAPAAPQAPDFSKMDTAEMLQYFAEQGQ
jgi:hypothetical protein